MNEDKSAGESQSPELLTITTATRYIGGKSSSVGAGWSEMCET
jgi:hypothetical protein